MQWDTIIKTFIEFIMLKMRLEKPFFLTGNNKNPKFFNQTSSEKSHCAEKFQIPDPFTPPLILQP